MNRFQNVNDWGYSELKAEDNFNDDLYWNFIPHTPLWFWM